MATGPSKVKKAATKSAASHPVYRNNDSRKLHAAGNNQGATSNADGITAAGSTARAPASSDAHDQTTRSGLVARGKDVLSGEVGGVATVVAIGLGAALIEIELIPGIIIGAGAILLGRLFPEIGSYVRPVAKSMLSAGYAAAQKAREVIAEASEQVTDMFAEVKHEREEERDPAPHSSKHRHNGAAPVDRESHAH